MKCGNKPNCASSLDERKKFYIEPISTKTPQSYLKKLVEKLKSKENVELKSFKDNVEAHLVFTTSIFKYKDDVILKADLSKNRIDLYSSSRLGYWDMGKNRSRLEEIKKIKIK